MNRQRVLHCWAGEREQYEFGSEAWVASYAKYPDGGDATCMLEAGHDGPHEFTPDSEIVVSFPPAPTDDE